MNLELLPSSIQASCGTRSRSNQGILESAEHSDDGMMHGLQTISKIEAIEYLLEAYDVSH